MRSEKKYDSSDAVSRQPKGRAKDTVESSKLEENEEHDDIMFQGVSSDFCVCMLNIVSSTVVTSPLSHDKIRKFYSLFVNSVSPIISHFDGRILKTGGDSIVYYFPKYQSLQERT